MEQNKEPSGVLLIDKHAGVTSHDIVNKVRRLYDTRRVGHTGTLDPLATGLLVVLVGRAAKAAEFLNADTKHYLAGLRLGVTTDTEDTTGKILTESRTLPSFAEVCGAAGGFCGKIMQTPPMYSAIKVNGKKLYELAREGRSIEREPREIEIFSISVAPTDGGDYSLDVVCSSGTYIRTLCADIGRVLGCGGAMSSLRRLAAGRFDISGAVSIDELEKMTTEERISRLLPVESLFSDCPEICLPEIYERLCRSGCEIYQKKIHTSVPDGSLVRLCDSNGGFFALGRVSEYPDGSTVKSVKMFDI